MIDEVWTDSETGVKVYEGIVAWNDWTAGKSDRGTLSTIFVWKKVVNGCRRP